MAIFSILGLFFRYFYSVHAVNLFFSVIGLVDYCFGTFLSEPHARPCLTHVPRMAVTLTYLPHHLFLPLIAIPDSTRTPKVALLHAWSPSKHAAPPRISLLRAPRRRGACSSHQPLPRRQPPSPAPATLTSALAPGLRRRCHRSRTTPPLQSLQDYAAAAIARDSATTAIARGSAVVFAWKGEILPRPRSCPPSLENT